MSAKLFILDSTLIPNKHVYFNSISELSVYLESMCMRKFNKTRSKYMQDLAELGHGYDSIFTDVAWIRAMQNEFQMGMIQNNRHIQSDLTMYSFNKPEYGD